MCKGGPFCRLDSLMDFWEVEEVINLHSRTLLPAAAIDWGMSCTKGVFFICVDMRSTCFACGALVGISDFPDWWFCLVG